jgi:catechol 2,3-dioxygenase-like lactoylglutathione lyase family enzyme
MIDHLSIAVTDMARALRFWDAVMAALGHPAVGRDDRWAGYGLRSDASHPERCHMSLRLTEPADQSSAVHWAFHAPARSAVDAFWRDGIAAGGTDDGAPGLRAHDHADYYAAFLRDPDGNRIEAVCHSAPDQT